LHRDGARAAEPPALPALVVLAGALEGCPVDAVVREEAVVLRGDDGAEEGRADGVEWDPAPRPADRARLGGADHHEQCERRIDEAVGDDGQHRDRHERAEQACRPADEQVRSVRLP